MSSIIGFFFFFSVIFLASKNLAAVIPNPGCQSHCGNVRIIPPFGIGKGCFFLPQFEVVCDRSQNPAVPRFSPALGSTQITSITPETVGIITTARIHCDNDMFRKNTSLPLGMPVENSILSYSSSHNVFMALGCDAFAYIPAASGTSPDYVSGCATFCSSEMMVSSEACRGSGCCLHTLPPGIKSYNLSLSRTGTENNSAVWKGCIHAFIADKSFAQQGGFNISAMMSSNYIQVPQIMDWVVETLTCEEAQNKRSDLVCPVNSKCLDSVNGYRCICDQGFRGNPFSADGCRDVDDCRSSSNTCHKAAKCVNAIGVHRCRCWIFFEGDGRESGSGCKFSYRYLLLAYLGIQAVGFTYYLLPYIVRYWKRKQRRKVRDENFERNGGSILLEKIRQLEERGIQTLKVISAEEIEQMTANYSDDRRIGKGGYGSVYIGNLKDGKNVAIKVSHKITQSQIDQFTNEALILSKLKMRNVVKLIGICLQTECPVLVYEYIPGGTLKGLISNERLRISWEERLRLAVEVANGLQYLHFGVTEGAVVHRDIKSDNILVSDNFFPKICDFGMSQTLEREDGVTVTHGVAEGLCLTPGYYDPHLLQQPQAEFRTADDVYSFGVVLAELLTRKHATEISCSVRETMQYMHLSDVLDANEDYHGMEDVLQQAVNLAANCMNYKLSERPTMRVVTRELQQIEHELRRVRQMLLDGETTPA